MTMTSSDNTLTPGAQAGATEQTGILQKMLTMMMEDNRRREKQQRRDTWFKRIAIARTAPRWPLSRCAARSCPTASSPRAGA